MRSYLRSSLVLLSSVANCNCTVCVEHTLLPGSGLDHKDYHGGEFKTYCFGTCMDIKTGGGGGGGGGVASFSGCRSRKGEESLVTLRRGGGGGGG